MTGGSRHSREGKAQALRAAMCVLSLAFALSCSSHLGYGRSGVEGAPEQGRNLASRPAAGAPSPGEMTLVGSVQDACHRPVGGAPIVVVSSKHQGCFWSMRADRSGAFVLPHLDSEATYQVFVEVKLRWCVAGTTTTVTGDGGEAVFLNISLPPPCCDAPRH